jgi:integrase
MATSESQLILSGACYNNFVDTIKSQATLEQYKYGITQFMKFLKIRDINNLMVMAQAPKEIQQKIIDYVKYMREVKQLGAVTIQLYLASIMHFYSINDVNLNRKRISSYIPEVQQNEDRPYTIQEIARLLEFSDLRSRAVILLFASTGMRIGAVPGLRLEHLTKIDKYQLYQIKVYAGFKKYQYITFCTPECRKAIDTYLDYRERCGEQSTPKSPLFREQFDTNDLGEIRKPKPLGVNAIIKILTKKLHLSGVMPVDQLKEGEKSGKKRKSVMTSHGFRKFVITTMVSCRIDHSVRNKLVGHSIGLDKSYWKPQLNDLLQEYLKVVDALTINEENRLKRKVEQLTVRVDKLDELEEQMNRLSKKLGLE